MANDFEIVGEVKIMGDVNVINNINQKLQQVNNTTNQGSGLFGKLGGSIQVALGNIGSQAVTAIWNDMKGLAIDTYNTVAAYEMMGLSLTSLAAREYIESDAVKATNDAIDKLNKANELRIKQGKEGNMGATQSYITMADAINQAGGRAQELLKWTKQLALHSPFTMEQVNAAMRTMMAYGFTSDAAQRLTENVVNFTAATGRGSEAVDRIALALGQITARGKLMGQELRQLTEAGVPAYDILRKMGFTLDDVRKGVVLAGPFMDAFSKTMEEDFGGAAQRTLTTWNGLMSSFHDLKSIGLIELFTGLGDAIKPFASDLFNWLSSQEMLDKLHQWGTDFGTFVTAIVNGIKLLPSTPIGSTVIDFFNAIKDFIANPPSFDSITLDWKKLQPESTVPDSVSAVQLAFLNLKNVLAQSAPEVKDKAHTWWDGIVKENEWALGQIRDNQDQYWTQINNNLAAGLNTSAQTYSENHDSMLTDADGFVGRLTDIYGRGIQVVAGYGTSIGLFLSGQFSLLASITQTGLDAMRNIASGNWDGLKSDIERDVGKIKTSLENMGTAFEPIAVGWGFDVNRIKLNMTTWYANMQIVWFDTLRSLKAFAFNSGQTVKGLSLDFQTWWDNINTNASISWTRFKNNVSGKWSEISAAMKLWPKQAYQVGLDLIGGLINGFMSSVDAFIKKVKKAVTDAIAAAKAAAASWSPSRKMMELGRNLMEGLTIGIDSSALGPIKAMSGAVGTLTGPTNYGGANVGGIVINISGAGDPYAVADAVMGRLTNNLKMNGILSQLQPGRAVS